MRARDPETGQSMNEQQLIDNLLTFYLRGPRNHRAPRWPGRCTWSRARRVWAALLEEEIERVTGGGPVDSAHIERLALVQQVVKESMRLYPPVPLLSRQCVAPARLDGVEYVPGATVWCRSTPCTGISALADPDAFDPTRFAPESEAKIPRYQYLPFGAGPRICIGMAFALLRRPRCWRPAAEGALRAGAGARAPIRCARHAATRRRLPLKVTLR
jgi:cytochrome P450